MPLPQLQARPIYVKEEYSPPSQTSTYESKTPKNFEEIILKKERTEEFPNKPTSGNLVGEITWPLANDNIDDDYVESPPELPENLFSPPYDPLRRESRDDFETTLDNLNLQLPPPPPPPLMDLDRKNSDDDSPEVDVTGNSSDDDRMPTIFVPTLPESHNVQRNLENIDFNEVH